MQNHSKVIRYSRALAIAVASAAALGGWTRSSQAVTSSATIATSQINSTTWQYSLTLSDAGGPNLNSIGTFWYAWIPAQDYLTTSPFSIVTPTGWTNDLVVNGGGVSNGYSIRWVANSSATYLLPGQSLSGFSFESSDPPSTIFGNTPFYVSTPTSTSETYSGAPFSANELRFVATAVPEPASLALIAPVAMLLGRRRKARA